MATTSTPPPRIAITRRALLKAALGAGGVAALSGGGYGLSRALGGRSGAWLASSRVGDGADGGVRRFRSRPDLRPATTTIHDTDGGPGYLFVGPAASAGAQAGPLIVDRAGDPVWFSARPGGAGRWVTTFERQSYRGAPVLTWWEGTVANGYGTGEGVIVDTSYREIARVRAVGGRSVDLHELLLTERGTALFTCAPVAVEADLSSAGGPRDGRALESVIQEVDVATGRLVAEWRSLQHVDVAESYRRASSSPFDYLHANSIEVMSDGNLLVSARHTWALYKLDRASGAVIWRLGGKRSDFAMGSGAQFAWQHDAREVSEGALTVFDDGFDGLTRSHAQSRAELLDVDVAGRRVSLRRAFVNPDAISSSAMGSARRLADGHVIVGWGTAPYATEFDRSGRAVAQLHMPGDGQKSYRALRARWSGTPADAPALAAERGGASGATRLYASWNGATEVAAWHVLAGARRSDLRSLGVAARHGFETAIEAGTGEGYVAVAALDGHGRELRRSPTVRV